MGSDDDVEDRQGTDVPRSLSMVAQRLHAEHPAVSVDTISGLLLLAYHRTEGARVQTFRTLLAERDTRAELNRSTAPVALDLSA
jgi:hypothetical protein